MGAGYRSWEERRQIIRAMIAETSSAQLSDFDLSKSEEVFFRARSARLVDKLAKRTSTFKTYYALPTDKPFLRVVVIVIIVLGIAAATAAYTFIHSRKSPAYPIYAALISLSVVAMGWAVSGWLAHRNTVRQHTNNMLFARFSHATFGDAMHRFHREFGYEVSQKITRAHTRALAFSNDEEKLKTATSVGYLLNYYELIAEGVLRGDLDRKIVQDNIKGVICYYYDKCEPYIDEGVRRNPKVFEHLVKLRTHYREP